MKRIILLLKPQSAISGDVHVALRRPERMKSAVRSPAFRPQAFGVTEWICIRPFRLKAGLRTDFPGRKCNEITSQSPSRGYLDTAVIPAPNSAESRAGAAAG